MLLLELTPDALRRFGATPEIVVDMFRDAGWHSVGIANSYAVEFYCDPPHRVVHAHAELAGDVIDLAFCRPSLRAKLLASDLAR